MDSKMIPIKLFFVTNRSLVKNSKRDGVRDAQVGVGSEAIVEADINIGRACFLE